MFSELSSKLEDEIKTFLIKHKGVKVGELVLDMSRKKFLSNVSTTDSLVKNPFLLKKNYNEVISLFEKRRLNKSRLKQYFKILGSRDIDLFEEIYLTHLYDIDDGVSVVPEDMESVDPVIVVSKGVQVKEYIAESNSWVKKDYHGGEAISEVIASRLGSLLGFDCVQYSFIEDDFTLCTSINMLEEGEELISLDRYLSSYFDIIELEKIYKYVFKQGSVRERLNKFQEIVKNIFNIKDFSKLYNMIVLDTICMNHDRHLNNISFIHKDGLFRISPIYDLGCSFLVGYNSSLLRRQDKEFLQLKAGYPIEPFHLNFRTLEEYLDLGKIGITQDQLEALLKDVPDCVTKKIARRRLEDFLH